MATEDWVDMDCFDALLGVFDCDYGPHEAQTSVDWGNDSMTALETSAGSFDPVVDGENGVDNDQIRNSHIVAKSARSLRKAPRPTQRILLAQSQSKESMEDCSNSSEGAQSKAPMKLLVFPVFEKRDALIHFPHSMSKLLNTGDLDSLSRIMKLHMDKDCKVRFHAAQEDSCTRKAFLDLMAFRLMLNPDGYICVHNIKVVEHEISATMYFKHTECKQLTEYVRKTTKNPEYAEIATLRGDKLRSLLHLEERPEEERQELNELIDSDHDMEVYGKVDMRLNIDRRSKKIVSFLFEGQFTSLVRCTRSVGSAGRVLD